MIRSRKSYRNRLTKTALLLSVSLAATMSPAAVSAQEETEGEDTAVLDTVTITATRRDNVTVQDVPASINVLSSDVLEDSDVRALGDLEQLAPSVQVTQTESAAAGTLISIRGIGTVANNPGFEPSVGVLIDGVFRTRTGVALSELPELESVEILRGPQGTLFGRNTSSGAVSINTAKPQSEPGGFASVTAGSFDALALRGAYSLPLSENWSSRVDAVYREREGFIEDANTGQDFNAIERYLVRGQIQYTGETSDFRLIADIGSSDEPCCAGLVIDPGPSAPLINAITAPQSIAAFGSQDIGDYETALSPNRSLEEEVDEWGVSAQYDREFENFNLTSITALRDWEVVRNQDVDGSGLDRSYREDYTITDQSFTQEFRLQGDTDLVSWLVGAYYLNQDLELTDTVRGGPDSSAFTDLVYNFATRSPAVPSGFQIYGTLPGVPSFLAIANPMQAGIFLPPVMDGEGQQADNFNVETNAFAVFTHNEWSLSDRVTLTTGLRYTLEQKDLEYNLNSISPSCDFVNANPAVLPLLGAAAPLVCSPAVNTEASGTDSTDREDTQLSGTAKLAFDLNDNALLYASYSRGFKSGGFNLARSSFDYSIAGGAGPSPTDLEFEAEVADSYEVGFNSTFAGRRVILNGAVYFQEIDDFQNLVFNGNNFVVFNAPAEGYGAELDLMAQPTSGLTIQSGLSYNNVELTEDIIAGTTFIEGNQQLARSPELTLTNAITYSWPIGETFEGLFHLNSRYVTEQTLASAGAAAEVEQDAFAVIGARIGLSTNDGRWTLSVFGDNIFDEDYLVQTFQLPELSSVAGYPGAPQTFGIELRTEF